MSRTASRPLDRGAVRAADDQFYANHPELIEDGERIPLDPSDPAQADLRSEWMDLYIANGGQVEGETPTADKRPEDVTEPCPMQPADLGVRVTDACNSSSIGGVDIEVSGPQNRAGTTNPKGWSMFENLPPGCYTLLGSHAGYNDASTTVWVSSATTQTAQIELQPGVEIQPQQGTYTVVLDSSGNAPAGHPILEFEITGGPPNHLFDLHLTSGHSSELAGGPGLAGSWSASDSREDRADKTAFSSWSNGQTSLRLDGNGAATYQMPLEWWRDLARIPREEFDELTIYFRVIAFADASSEPCALSTTDEDHASACDVMLRSNLERFRLLDGGYIAGGVRKSLRVEFTVREANTSEMYTIVQWMEGYAGIWGGTPPVMSHPQHQIYSIRHEGNFPDTTVDSLTLNPRPSFFGGAGGPSVSADGLTAHGTDRPGGALPPRYSHMYVQFDFQTRLHLNFEVPAAVHIVRQDGSPPVYGVITGVLPDPQPVTLDSDDWNVRILQERTAAAVNVTHPDNYAGP